MDRIKIYYRNSNISYDKIDLPSPEVHYLWHSCTSTFSGCHSEGLYQTRTSWNHSMVAKIRYGHDTNKTDAAYPADL